MNGQLRHIESVWYTPDETMSMLEGYASGKFNVFVFFGVEVPFNRAILKIGMETIRRIRDGARAALGEYNFTAADEQELIKAFLIAVSRHHSDMAARPIWLLAENNIPGLRECATVPANDCISIRIVFEGDINVHTVFSQFTIDELMASAEAAIAKGKLF